MLQELLSVLSGLHTADWCCKAACRAKAAASTSWRIRDYVAVVTQMTDKPVLSLLQQQMV